MNSLPLTVDVYATADFSLRPHRDGIFAEYHPEPAPVLTHEYVEEWYDSWMHAGQQCEADEQQEDEAELPVMDEGAPVYQGCGGGLFRSCASEFTNRSAHESSTQQSVIPSGKVQ